MSEAMIGLGSDTLVTLQTDEREYWRERLDCPDVITASQRMQKKTPPTAEWVVAPRMEDYKSKQQQEAVGEILSKAMETGADIMILCWPNTKTAAVEAKVWEDKLRRLAGA